MKNVSYAKRGYHYVKNYGVARLGIKVQERLHRNSLEKGYQDWLFARRPGKSEKELQRTHVFTYRPLISIVVPIFRTPELYLREMIESVLSQTYVRLELCLADGSGGDETAGEIIRSYMQQDDRIRYKKLEHNLGISGNTNEALAMASGDYVGFLDHDDLLEEHALFEIVKWLQSHSDADMILSLIHI